MNIIPYKPKSTIRKTIDIPPIVKLADNKAIGMSVDSDNNPARGTLYPTNIPIDGSGGTRQSILTDLFGTEPSKFYAQDDQLYSDDEAKLKVGERFFGGYKRLVAMLYQSFTANPQDFPSTAAAFYQIYRVVWLDASRFAMLYQDNTSAQQLRLVVGQISASTGLVSFGASVLVKTFADSTHTGYGMADMDMTVADRLLISYTNKVSTNYWWKGRTASISGTTITLNSESADLINFGTSAYKRGAARTIRASAGAGAMGLITPIASGGTTTRALSIMQHDASNNVTAGTPLDIAGASGFTYANIYSYATDRVLVTWKVSTTDNLTARLYSVSGTTPTALGAAAMNITGSTSNQHYINGSPYAFMDFGSGNVGLLHTQFGQYGVKVLNTTGDVLSSASSFVTHQFGSENTSAIGNGNGKATIYSVWSSNGQYDAYATAFFADGKLSISDNTHLMGLADNFSSSNNTIYPSTKRVLFLESSQNYNQQIDMWIGAGDNVIEILDEDDNLLKTITETFEGGGHYRLETIGVDVSGDKLAIKVKNNTGEHRLIRISAIYAEVE